MAIQSYFITGTDTGVGKTLISCALLHALSSRGLRTAAMKPIAAGTELHNGVWCNEDCELLAEQVSVQLPRALTTPYLLREAAAPHIAAQLEGVTISTAHIQDCYQQVAAAADIVIVEGVGGFKVPLTMQTDTADLAAQLDLPVILVVGMRLGCLNHALLSADAVLAQGLPLVGWVASCIDPAMPHLQANIDTLATLLPCPHLGTVPWLPEQSGRKAAQAASYLNVSLLPPAAAVNAPG